MSYQEWASLITPSTSQGSGAGAVLNTATTATLSPVMGNGADVAQVNYEGSFQGWQQGMQIRVLARGYITSTTTSTTATFLLATRVGNTGSTYVTLATTAGMATSTTAITGAQWILNALIRCTAVATSGSTVATQGEIHISPNPATAQTLNTASAGVDLMLPSASGETNAAVDTTQVQGLSMRATLAGANATIALTQWMVESLN